MVENKEKILIIEDDRFLLKILTNKFRQENFTISQAVEGKEGLRKIMDEKPDLVLLDIILPGKNGFEILSEMRRNEETKNTPVIIISNLGQIGDIERGLALGAKGYIIKTELNLDETIEKVKEILIKSREKKE